MEYKNAPLSECICGVIFNHSIFTDDCLFKINSLFSECFPIVEIHPPLFIEEVVNDHLQPVMNPVISGQVLYRRRTTDRKWLLQIQKNLIYLNWIRTDSENVGDYVGFNKVFAKFKNILNKIKEELDIDVYANIYLCDITYNDRIELSENGIPNLTVLEDYLNISVPSFPYETNRILFNHRDSFVDKEIKLFGIIDLNLVVNSQKRDFLQLGIVLRGGISQIGFDKWFEEAHLKQHSIFESVVKQKLLDKWK